MQAPVWLNAASRSAVWLAGAIAVAILKCPEGAHLKSLRSDSVIWIGIVLPMLGIGLHAWSNVRLCHAEYTRTVARDGPFASMRNPIYLAGFLILAGVCFLYTNPNSADIIGGVVLLVFFHLRVTRFEEPALLQRFGDTYRQYCNDVSRWVPGERLISKWLIGGRTKP